MKSREQIKKYSNEEITIFWQPSRCIHAGECVKALPGVYNPKAKPWIRIENATTEELKSQIAKCPSGALSYRDNREEAIETLDNRIKIEVLKNGPLLIHGPISVTGIRGEQEEKNRVTAFCRCGASQNKPYCDGSHKKINFTD